MKKISILLLLFVLTGTNILTAQKLASTLLWKINGNGLEKSSYLYGTMHLTDDRIFNLGDSLYRAIETTDGFAIEINPEDLTPFIIDEAKKYALKARLLKETLSERDFKKYGRSLAKKLNKDENDITTADVFREKNKWIEESYRTGKMQTFLDAYLFDVARKLGKWTGGVEDLEDQAGAMNYLIDEWDIQQLTIEETENSNNSQIKSSAEQMIKFYVNDDLNALGSLSNSGDSLYLDILLTKRNKKMAMRMDSLSRQRSMVFAVGAAHLPGDDGLIALLKQKGFTVTPVLSSKKIKPKDYKVPDVQLPWNDVKDDKCFYTVSMPGKPGDMALYGLINMKMYFDVFSSTVYMVTALNTPYSQTMADSVFGVVESYYFETTDYKKEKPVIINDVPGREFLSTKNNYSHGYLLFKNGMMYMAIGTCMKKDTSAAISINRFLHSFTILKNNSNDNSTYFTYTDKAKAYRIDLPAPPMSANDLFSMISDTSIDREINAVTDPESGAYLFFGVNQAAKGFYIGNDSATFGRIREAQKDKFSNITIDTMYIRENHRIMEFGGMMSQAPLMMKTYYESRGNRWYVLMAMYDTAKASTAVERFFTSFSMLDYPVYEWNHYSPDDKLFTTWAPLKFEFNAKPSSYGIDTAYKYECFDTSRANDYAIVVENFGRYYWQNNDSTLWEKIIEAHLAYKDSLISKKAINNEDAKGFELTVQERASTNIERKRILLNGDKLYTLLTVQPSTEIFNNNNNKFFEEFRFTDISPVSTLLVSKTTLLLSDLNSGDSAVRAEAISFLPEAPFAREDLFLLHEALLKKYPDDKNSYQTTAEIIVERIIGLKDTSSFLFAKNNYLLADDEIKNLLLTIMVSFPTKENFNSIKNFLLQNPPTKKLDYSFINKFTDSLQLASTVFEELLPLLKDTALAPAIIRIAKPLLDSNLVNLSFMQPYRQNILQLALKQYKIIKNDPDNYDYTNYSIISLLGKMNDPESNSMLQRWSLLKSTNLQLYVVGRLLNNKQALNQQALQSLAADKTSRIELYDSLLAYKKEMLFPKEYLTQKHFAESYVYTTASDEDEPSELTYLTQKIINFKGKQSRFFFYKVAYGEEEDATYSLACAGPFSIKTEDISANDATGALYYDEDFDPADLPQQMDALIKHMEKWYRQKNE